MAFKTRQIDWINTVLPAVALVSVHSKFNEGVDGYFKMAAFLSTIRENVKGKIALLVADAAHLHTSSLANPLASYLQSAQELILRYRSYADGFEVLYWSSSIMSHKEYTSFKNLLQQLMQRDDAFRSSLLADAEAAYTEKRRKEFPDQKLFIEKMIADLIEQCVCIQILGKQGYRYLFYPGPPCASAQYINDHYILPENRLHWIDVFITIEKKTKVSQEKWSGL